MGFSGNLKQELQEPRLREAGDGEYLPGADVQPLSSQTEPTAAMAKLDWTCSRSQVLARGWSIRLHISKHTHLGPSVIPEQINCYVGAKEGQGDLWEVPL